jgi:hypothetical protein
MLFVQLQTLEKNSETFETVVTMNTDGPAFSRVEDPAKRIAREIEANSYK